MNNGFFGWPSGGKKKAGIGLGVRLLDKVELDTPKPDIPITFIPSNLSHLLLCIDMRSTAVSAAQALRVQFNGDVGNNYQSQWGDFNNGVYGASSNTNMSYAWCGYMPAASDSASLSSASQVMIFNYLSSTFYKHLQFSYSLIEGLGANQMWTGRGDAWWRSVAAIRSIRVLPDSGNFSVGTTVELYGLP